MTIETTEAMKVKSKSTTEGFACGKRASEEVFNIEFACGRRETEQVMSGFKWKSESPRVDDESSVSHCCVYCYDAVNASHSGIFARLLRWQTKFV
ncbi:hypothetical protein HS088_TW16G00583 [Tripterygium wilfordii]|uniref:Uncharacterized protein n=1 Tax=Tripterygium wilfordii TaxID=458696 RepID=A0A7J7CJB1_TRIWF|nr:hypothetical protein HS088_TW16G00583 [Tripterygium wilfordii]